jgi:ACS family hexuronate transporter-like MFS transporter
MSMAGSIGGGWLPAKFLKLGWSLNAARKTAMLVCALAVVPVMAAANAGHLWLAVALVGVATAAHQGWSANLYTIVSDTFPKHAVGSVIGIGGFGGAVGGMLIATFTGWLLEVTGSYVPVFVIAGSAYLVALIVIQLLVPKLEPARIEKQA